MWFVGKNDKGIDLSFDVKDFDAFEVNQPDSEQGEDKPFYLYGRLGANWIPVFNGTQVECIRFHEKLMEYLKPIRIDIWA